MLYVSLRFVYVLASDLGVDDITGSRDLGLRSGGERD